MVSRSSFFYVLQYCFLTLLLETSKSLTDWCYVIDSYREIKLPNSRMLKLFGYDIFDVKKQCSIIYSVDHAYTRHSWLG